MNKPALTARQRKDIIAAVNEWADNLAVSVLLLGGDGSGDRPEDYAAAIIGTVDTPRPAVVYLSSKVIEELLRMNPKSDWEEMSEYYDYNIVRSIPYYEQNNPPVLVDDLLV